ncbi:Endogenous retrovirus group K member 9 Pol protein, partial [Eudyptula minor novaehollandiae]
QLRATVNESGVKGEPTRQMLDYLWATNILLPGDIRSIMKLILTQHQHHQQQQSLCLQPATSGSLGLDLATAIDCTLLDSKPTRIPTGMQGPICVKGQPVGALLIGRSSATLLGLTVLVGLIDKDYQGEIQIMVQTLFPPLFVKKGSKIAQLIPLPHLAESVAPMQAAPRGAGAFGSTGQMALLTVGLKQQPRRTALVQYAGQSITLSALLDTGADVSIISERHWPHDWPARTTGASVAGVGGLTLARKS